MRVGDIRFQAGIQQLLAEIMLARAAAFDLDKVCRREYRAEHAEVEYVRAIVAGGHHAHCHAHARLAGLVGGQDVGGAKQVVVGEIDRELLRARNLRSDLHREVGLILAGEHAVGHYVQYLRQLGRVVLADGEDDGFADFAADGITQGVFQKSLTKQLVGCIREKAFLELALFVGFFLIVAAVVGVVDNKAFFGQQLGGDVSARIDDGGVDEVALFHAIEQGIAERGLAVFATEGAIGIEQQAAFGFAWVARRRFGFVESLQVIARRGGQPQFVANEVIEHCARVATDGTVRFVGDHQIEIGG